MKTIYQIIPIALFGLLFRTGNAQDELTKAFRQSYYNESYQKYDEALKDIKAVYDVNSYVVNLRMGWLSYENGDFMESNRFYEKAIELKPNSIEARLGYAYPLNSLLDIEKLISNYQMILKINPNHALSNYRLALIYYNKKDFNQAVKYLETILNIYPFDYDSLVLMAVVNIGLGNIEEAKKNYRMALLYYPDYETILAELYKL